MAALATSIDEVIAQLGDVIDRSLRERNRLGFFAALYRKVTIKVKEGIVAGRFDDGPRMERLDVIFANRYLEALTRLGSGQAPTPCWALSFEAAATWPPIILQHLLLGMNAHINFDLGIAAATTCPGAARPARPSPDRRAPQSRLTRHPITRVQRRAEDHRCPERDVHRPRLTPWPASQPHRVAGERDRLIAHLPPPRRPSRGR